MKKILLVVLALLLVCSQALAEDAVSSATLKINQLPVVDAADNGILVVYFSPDDTVRAAAYTIAAVLSAELFEIVSEEPYTADDLNYNNSKMPSLEFSSSFRESRRILKNHTAQMHYFQ